MKIPRIPPQWHQFLPAILKKHPSALFEVVYPYEDRYLHWDDFRHKPIPEGLTHEEWWALIKYRRVTNQNTTPVLDKKGKPFVFGLTEKMFEQVHQIDFNAGGVVEMIEDAANQDLRDRYYISSIMEESITSSLLEGAATTRKDAKEFLRSGRRPHTLAEKMVINNYETMQRLVDLKDEPFSMEKILEIHGWISRGTLDSSDQEGRFRKSGEHVEVGSTVSDEVYHIPPNADELHTRMEQLCAFANETEMKGFLHPVIRAIIIHFWLAYDHPFVDGNGRTARALFYWSMLKQGFWLFEFVSISRELHRAPTAYAKSFLYTETDENDLNYFILHQLNVIEKQIQHLHEYLARKQDEMARISKSLGRLTEFNHRQIAILQKALKQPHTIFTFKSHQNSHRIAYQTARSDLLGLAEKHLLIEGKRKNATTFRAAPDLSTHIEIRDLL